MKYEIREAQYEDGKLSGWGEWHEVETSHHSGFAAYVKIKTIILADHYADGIGRALVEVREVED